MTAETQTATEPVTESDTVPAAPATEADAGKPRTTSALINSYMVKRLHRLQQTYLQRTATAKADLATLRSIDPTKDDRLVMAWEASFDDAPVELVGRGDAPTKAERVVVSGLHLYAVHQQSLAVPMHELGRGLGTAIRALANPSDSESREKPVMRRYHALSTATEYSEIMHHLRGLVSQFRSSKIPLDYAKLTTDLYFLLNPETRTRVRLAWARDLARKSKAEDEPAAAETSN
ncbi:MAG: type I-E CRISPR-associated protein Cse2/CasB [Gulosibacter sp.]|uniref:type I-E CRISPR-associated protein Cse2/CasB n=1 Tax=Gulosibacter sp. TaxID=2817531 RepID=UPI003F8F7525